jgi:hypothetical protein
MIQTANFIQQWRHDRPSQQGAAQTIEEANDEASSTIN